MTRAGEGARWLQGATGQWNVRRERMGASRRPGLEACGDEAENARVIEWERPKVGKERGEGRTRIFWQGDKVSSPRREHKIGRDKNLIPDRV